MPIFKGDNWQHLYKGDGHPAALYKGSKKLAGWTEESQAGVSHAYFDDTYNDKAVVVIHGKSSQVVTTGKNIFDIDDLISSPTIGGEYKEFVVSGLEQNTLYTMSAEIPGSIVSEESNKRCLYFSVDGSRLIVDCVFAGNPKTITTNEEGSAHIILFLDRDYSQTILNGKGNIQIEKGENATPFEPYTGGAPSPSPDYPQEIKSVGGSGSVEVVSMGENLYTGGDLYNVTGTESKTFLAPGTEMRLDAICDNVSGSVNAYMRARYYDKDNNLLGSNGRAKRIEGENIPFDFFMMGIDAEAGGGNVDMSNVRKVRLDTTNYPGYDGVFNVRNIMIQPLIPDKPLNNFSGYEQQPSTATFSTPNGLPGIPVDSGGNYTDEEGQQWICDEIDTKAGVYRQRVGKVQYVGDTSEAWVDYTNKTYKGFSINVPDRKIAAFNPGICNRFRVDMVVASTDPGIWIGSTNAINTTTRIYFHNCNPSIASSVEEWRTWLSTHPVTLIYPLETPVETPLSDAVDTFLGGTNLFVSEHEMDVTVKTEDQANPTGA